MHHVHFLGICGTFMGSLALLARELGYKVTGQDAQVYPPMSTQLAEQGIEVIEGYEHCDALIQADQVIVGNAMTRGKRCVEYMLANQLKYTSGPQWLCDHVLQDRWVLAVSGTHGKTTTSTMLAWILEHAGLEPGYLIGGVPKNFSVSARLGQGEFFVIEADEYDSAFFDKRSKFIHYRPKTLIINNLEFDHGDIFDSLAEIQKQFHHVVRTVPENGRIIIPESVEAIDQVIAKGAWSKLERIFIGEVNLNQSHWYAKPVGVQGQVSDISVNQARRSQSQQLTWKVSGLHNLHNGLMAIAAADHAGVSLEQSCAALSQFDGVKRRLELLDTIDGICVYDDFAHHPTAIQATLKALSEHSEGRVLAVIEPRSSTMKLGLHGPKDLAHSCALADQVFWFQPSGLNWSVKDIGQYTSTASSFYDLTDQLISDLVAEAKPGDHIVIMSNGGFEGIHQRLIQALRHSKP